MDKKEQHFTLLLREYKSMIYTICYMFSDNKEEVEDLFQDICIRLWNGYDGFRHESSPKTWIWRVAMNSCINYQKQSEREHVSLDMNVDLFASPKEDTRQIQMLYDRIHRLGIFDRTIVLLWLENMPYEEIAAITGLSVKNISVRLVRIKEQLKNM